MPDYTIMKAVEHAKLPAKFKKQYPTVQSLADAGWWTQKKYDGCMGIAHMRFNGGSTMQSRTGEDYTPSCQHILEELREAATDRAGSWDDFVVIGEVWLPIDMAEFPTISGMFRRQRASKLQFIANDLLPPGLNTNIPYRDRHSDLVALLPPSDGPGFYCNVAETFKDERLPEAQALAWQGQGGFDGAILRDPDAGYKVGTVKAGEIVKVKPTMSLDLVVQRTACAPGAKTGRPVYTIVVEYKGVTSFVGSGVPHTLSWSAGDIVEVECLGITADGKLREPRWKGLRFDKLEADA